jgi:hypothetical protein
MLALLLSAPVWFGLGIALWWAGERWQAILPVPMP